MHPSGFDGKNGMSPRVFPSDTRNLLISLSVDGYIPQYIVGDLHTYWFDSHKRDIYPRFPVPSSGFSFLSFQLQRVTLMELLRHTLAAELLPAISDSIYICHRHASSGTCPPGRSCREPHTCMSNPPSSHTASFGANTLPTLHMFRQKRSQNL